MTITPETREELFLASASGQSVDLPTPVTREEMFLAKMAGKIENAPEPITRKEMFLKAVADNSGGGSGGDDASIARSILDRTIVEYSDDAITTIGENAFRMCKKLKAVNVPNVANIGEYAFANCSALEYMSLPKVDFLPEGAFVGCTALREVSVPKVVVVGNHSSNSWVSVFHGSSIEILVLPSATHISRAACGECKKLAYVDFGARVYLWGDAFSGCSALTTMIFRANSVCDTFNVSCLYGTPIASGTGYIYVPAALVESYKAATNWSTFADQIRAIEDYPEICGEVSA